MIFWGSVVQQTGMDSKSLSWMSGLSILLVVLAALEGRSRHMAIFSRLNPLHTALILLLLQAAVLGWRFISQPAPATDTIFQAAGLAIQALLLLAALVAYRQSTGRVSRLAFNTPFAKLVLWTLLLTFVALVTGATIAETGGNACQGWPLCNGRILPADLAEALQLGHRLIVGIGSVLTVMLFLNGWRTQRYQTGILLLMTAGVILFIAQGLIGALLSMEKSPSFTLTILHAATGASVWGIFVLLALQVGLSGRSVEFEQLDAFDQGSRGQRLRDFTALTKPVIVLLLLATTFGGMIVGARAWPRLDLVVWTFLGGALAAGGSGAINQYIDREVDKQMKRTQRRPVAAGRLTPAEALAFGVGLCLAAFLVLSIFVNLLSAVLAFAGMVYYVWLYSIVLKKTTVQNIVIGGGAGAIPPLVGWAAVTGSLTWPSLLLFAIIFFWTPPHFWALALVRTKDYARGGIPMLPVVRGEDETKKQIVLYTLLLVGITLLAPLVGLSGMVYFVGAAVLGLYLIGLALRLRRDYSPKLAFKMYRHSSYYLLLLFVLMAVDALIL